jgi:hypothetical protein
MCFIFKNSHVCDWKAHMGTWVNEQSSSQIEWRCVLLGAGAESDFYANASIVSQSGAIFGARTRRRRLRGSGARTALLLDTFISLFIRRRALKKYVREYKNLPYEMHARRFARHNTETERFLPRLYAWLICRAARSRSTRKCLLSSAFCRSLLIGLRGKLASATLIWHLLT